MNRERAKVVLILLLPLPGDQERRKICMENSWAPLYMQKILLAADVMSSRERERGRGRSWETGTS